MSGFGSMIKEAKATGGGNYIRAGKYRLMIEKIILHNGYKGAQSFIAEMRVMESASNGATDDDGKVILPNAVGSSCSFVGNLKHDAAPGNIKAFVVAALAGLGYTEDDVTPDVIDSTYAEHNPLRGLVIIDETYEGINKGRTTEANRGKKLTLNKWKPVTQTAEDLKAGRAYLDRTLATLDKASPAPKADEPTTEPASVAVSNPKLAALLGKS